MVKAAPDARDGPWWIATRSVGAHRADHQGGAGGVGVVVDHITLVALECDHLQRLAQTHVVGENASDAQVRQMCQPVQTPLLIGAQYGLQIGWGSDGLGSDGAAFGDVV